MSISSKYDYIKTSNCKLNPRSINSTSTCLYFIHIWLKMINKFNCSQKSITNICNATKKLNLCRHTAKKSKEWFTTILKMDDKINAQTLYSNSLKTNISIDNNLLFCYLWNVYIIMKLAWNSQYNKVMFMSVQYLPLS